MNIKKVNVERIDITSLKPFEAVTAALEAAVGRPDLAKYIKETEGAPTLAEMESSRRGARTHACSVHTRVNAWNLPAQLCSQECEHGTHWCVRYILKLTHYQSGCSTLLW
jgi:hypothetical protein